MSFNGYIESTENDGEAILSVAGRLTSETPMAKGHLEAQGLWGQVAPVSMAALMLPQPAFYASCVPLSSKEQLLLVSQRLWTSVQRSTDVTPMAYSLTLQAVPMRGTLC